jgi:hypothetical protein
MGQDANGGNTWVSPTAEPGHCLKCGREAETTSYIGDGGMMAVTHGFSQQWCEMCIVRGQIAYVQDQAARLPDLEAKLATLEGTT